MTSSISNITRDPLLAIARALLWILMASMAIAVAACLVAIPMLLIFQDDVTIAVAREVPGIADMKFFWMIGAILLLSAGLCAALLRIFYLLKRIVDTVAEGDPFVPDNASRLTHMAWLSLAVQVITIPITAIALWIERMADSVPYRGEHNQITVESGLSGNGLLLMLILFILARVFRKGAEMRADLEGTV